MQYRTLPRSGEAFSAIGLGLGTIHELPMAEIDEILAYAVEQGINFFDLCLGHIDVYRAFARVSAGRRDKLFTQMHFGAAYEQGDKYGVSRDPEVIKRTFHRLLKEMNTDYTDMGYFHCVDEMEHVEHFMSSGIFDYVVDMKRQGLVRHIGFSSHTPAVARRFLETGVVDMCMFSINPAYDYAKGKYGYGAVDERAELYSQCERMGVGISVMKPFGAGQLLDVKTSPIGVSLTREQCIQYALDRPAVLTCLPGVMSMQHVKEVLRFFDATEDERSYAILGEATPAEAEGRCVYCNHCQPCPAGIDIGLVNKYYDLAMVGDPLAKSHYHNLSTRADACIQCGQCDSQCPFKVQQVDRMQAIARYFG